MVLNFTDEETEVKKLVSVTQLRSGGARVCLFVCFCHVRFQTQIQDISCTHRPVSANPKHGPSCSSSLLPPPHPDRLTCTLTHWIIWQQNGRWDLNPDSLAPEFMLFLIKIYYLLKEFSSFSLSQSKETFPAQV